LKTAPQFAAVMDASKARGTPQAGIWRSEHFVLHMAPLGVLLAGPNPAPKLSAQGLAPEAAKPNTIIGVVCPKRFAKRAVTRNTIKRQIYAVSSELQTQLPRACLVLRLHAAFSSAAFHSASSRLLKSAIRAELLDLLRKPGPLMPASQP
jgi:ribonuclease P protein component